MAYMKNACKILVGTPEGKRPLGKRTRRWLDNIKMNLKEIRCEMREVVNWTHLAQNRLL